MFLSLYCYYLKMSEKSLKRIGSPHEEEDDESEDYFEPLTQPNPEPKVPKMDRGKAAQPFALKLVRVKKKKRKLYVPGILIFFTYFGLTHFIFYTCYEHSHINYSSTFTSNRIVNN